jgi:hypothetical protein
MKVVSVSLDGNLSFEDIFSLNAQTVRAYQNMERENRIYLLAEGHVCIKE